MEEAEEEAEEETEKQKERNKELELRKLVGNRNCNKGDELNRKFLDSINSSMIWTIQN